MSVSSIVDKWRQHNPIPWHQWMLVILVILFGLLLRLYALDDIFLWMDETDLFDQNIYDHMPVSLKNYAAKKAQEHTVGPFMFLITALFCRVFGDAAGVARLPSVLFGTGFILAIFLLAYRVFHANPRKKSFFPAIFAAFLVAISITQIEFSQRTFPYGSVPLLTALLIMLHLEIVRAFQEFPMPVERFSVLAFLYAMVAGFAVYIHLSFTVVLLASFLVVLFLARRILELDRDKMIVVLAISFLTVGSIFLAWAGNYLHQPQSSYRSYLAPYYHRLDFGAIGFLAARSYDLLTYNLNLFYNELLYWPRKLNPAILPLAGLCVLGWAFAAGGKFGRMSRQLSLMAALCLALTAFLSLVQKYPFGGVRQSLFMAPFVFVFTAFGFTLLFTHRIGRAIGVFAAVIYAGLWTLNLPSFYKDRVTPFSTEEIVEVWKQNDRLDIFSIDGSYQFVKYVLHDNPDIEIAPLPYPSFPEENSFLIISTWWELGSSLWDTNLLNRIQESGYEAKLLMTRSPKYPVDSDYIQSLYFPPNGLWIYIIKKESI